ncbi:Na+/H+ antiporter subunit E [Salinirubellus salinus]|uniref:Na+/H+ antiporter subunit E n=1 Tax=Salinirubellus salinus TaxID=1364945 RepID=A0A9E7R8K8_9EURY|nr:Na+/H+ antiporter subunit E [Salinirubellus salinus]UWM56605.1 Na+/H+ antiporter subunit E [Salinirubellus salinus]
MTRKWPLSGLALAVLWLFVRGVEAGPTLDATLRNVAGEFLIGLVVGLAVAFAIRRYFADQLAVDQSIRVVPAALAYLVTFFWELLTANVDVAYRVLAPSLPIDPEVVAVPLRVESDVAITTIANSITLTPGTLTMDHDAETNTLYVHAISAKDRESVLAPIRRWEDYALVMFEGRDPSLEVPRRPGPETPEPDAATDGGATVAGATAADEEGTVAPADDTGGESDGR